MDMSFATKDGVPAIRLATHDTASMLFRHVEVALDPYPFLSWRWYVEQDIGSFPHYVANGGRANVGRWHREVVDLAEIHRTLWGDPTNSRLVDIGIFCDTDETGGESVAYVSDVRVMQRSSETQ